MYDGVMVHCLCWLFSLTHLLARETSARSLLPTICLNVCARAQMLLRSMDSLNSLQLEKHPLFMSVVSGLNFQRQPEVALLLSTEQSRHVWTDTGQKRTGRLCFCKEPSWAWAGASAPLCCCFLLSIINVLAWNDMHCDHAQLSLGKLGGWRVTFVLGGS